MAIQNKRRMYGMIYRARRKGSDINTRERTIYRPYTPEITPPPATRKGVDKRVRFWHSITN
jgi:hypothetical protein